MFVVFNFFCGMFAWVQTHHTYSVFPRVMFLALGLREVKPLFTRTCELTHLLFSSEKIPARTGGFMTVRLPGHRHSSSLSSLQR